MMKRLLFTLALSLATLSLLDSGYSDNIDYTYMTEWERFTLALIQVESGGDSLAVGPTNDLGILQITPIYVREANRLCGDERYTLECRTSRTKSLEMFEIIQSHYNPDRDIEKGIKLHNPGAGQWYADRIYDKMNELKNNTI